MKWELISLEYQFARTGRRGERIDILRITNRKSRSFLIELERIEVKCRGDELFMLEAKNQEARAHVHSYTALQRCQG